MSTLDTQPPGGISSPPSLPAGRGIRALAPHFARWGTIVAFLVVFALFSIARPDTFLTWENWRQMLNLAAALFVIAAVLTVPMTMNDFDLSIGYHVQILGAFVIVLVAQQGFPAGAGIALTLVLGATIGAVVGGIVAFSGVSAFIVTLGAGFVMWGAELLMTNDGRNIFEGIPAGYLDIANTTFFDLPLPVWIAIAVLVVLWFVTEHTVLGRYMAAVGGNIEAARLGGVNVELVRLVGFVIVGLGAALASILVTAQASQYFANAATGYLLPAYAGLFIGAATLRGGIFHIPGTAFGILFMQMIQTGLILLNWKASTAYIVQGLVLVGAVLLSRVGSRRT
jgi:ribose transport system permease protein